MLELKKKTATRETWQCTKCGSTFASNIGKCACEVAKEKKKSRKSTSGATRNIRKSRPTQQGHRRTSQREKTAFLGKLEEYIDKKKAQRNIQKEPDMFPFETIREGQKDFLKDAREAVINGNTLIAHAPTGLGKTAAVLSAVLEYSLPHKKTVFFLTSRQSQHKIAINTLRLIQKRCGTEMVIIDVISKQNMCPNREAKGHYQSFRDYCNLLVKKHRCRYHETYSMPPYEKIANEILHVAKLADICENSGICPHRAAMDMGKYADIIVCDYNYIFSDMLKTMLDRFEIHLDEIIIIVDEAHNLPDRIRQHLSSHLTPFTIKEALREVRRHDRSLERHLQALSSLFENLTREVPMNDEQNIEKGLVVGKIENPPMDILGTQKTFDDVIEGLAHVGNEDVKKGSDRSLALELADFLKGWNNEYESCLRIFQNHESPRLLYKVLDPSVLSSEVFANVHSSILMSGTLYPPKMYGDILGISESRTILKEYTSPFPKENRPVIVTKGLTTAYTKRGPEMYKNFADTIVGITKLVKGNLAVFFPSYKLMSDISRLMQNNIEKRIITEDRNMDKQDKDKIHDLLIRSRKNKGAIILGVMGGSLSEGIDYEGNVLESVIVVGLPLAPPSLETNALKKFYVIKFDEEKGQYYGYINPAMNKVAQAMGRCIRSESDRAVVILMDDRFSWDKYNRCFPRDMEMVFTSTAEILVSRFFSGGNR